MPLGPPKNLLPPSLGIEFAPQRMQEKSFHSPALSCRSGESASHKTIRYLSWISSKFLGVLRELDVEVLGMICARESVSARTMIREAFDAGVIVGVPFC